MLLRRTLTLCTALLIAIGVASAAAPSHAGAFVYWSCNCTGMHRGTNDGSVNDGHFIDTPPVSSAVAIDARHVYWASSDGRIGRANLDGSEPNPNLITGLPASSLLGLAVDGSHVYWSSIHAIGRANLDGTGVNQNFIAPIGRAVGLAVNGSRLYWGENGIGKIGSAGIDGSRVDEQFIPAPGDPCSVAVDGTYVYWADATGNTVGRATLGGKNVEPAFINPGFPVGCGVAVDASHLYFGNFSLDGQGIARAALDGSGVQPLFLGGPAPFVGMAVNSQVPVPFFVPIGPFHRFADGTAGLGFRVDGPGVLSASGKQIKAVKTTERKAGGGTLGLKIRAKGQARRKLRRTGKVTVRFKVTFSPSGGSPATKSFSVKLRHK